MREERGQWKKPNLTRPTVQMCNAICLYGINTEHGQPMNNTHTNTHVHGPCEQSFVHVHTYMQVHVQLYSGVHVSCLFNEVITLYEAQQGQ